MIEGRDIGTVVAPQAEVKVYLVADPAVARGRRQAERPDIGARRARDRPQAARRVRPRRACSRPRTRVEIDTTELGDRGRDRADRGARPRPVRRLMAYGDFAWRTSRLWLAPLTSFLCRARAYGLDRIPETGGCVLAINHLAWIDIPVVGVAVAAEHQLRREGRAARACPASAGSSAGTGSSTIKRGESDRDAVRLMRQLRRATGRAIGLFVEGTRQKQRAPGDGAAGRGDGRDPGGCAGRADRRLRHPVLEALQLRALLDRRRRAVPLRGLPKGGKGYKEASAEIERRLNVLFDWLADVHARGRPKGPDARRYERPDIRNDTRSDDSAVPDLLGTVAIVGFPNVGKSTLINRLTSSRAAVVHETSGTTRDRKELVCEWAGKQFLLDRHRRRRRRRARTRSSRSIVEQARLAIGEADLVLFVVDARAGVDAGRRGARRDPPPRRQAGAPDREQDRRPVAGHARVRVCTGSASATRSRSPGCTGTAPATCSTRSSPGSRTSARPVPSSATRRSASRSSAGRTSASRRSSTS